MFQAHFCVHDILYQPGYSLQKPLWILTSVWLVVIFYFGFYSKYLYDIYVSQHFIISMQPQYFSDCYVLHLRHILGIEPVRIIARVSEMYDNLEMCFGVGWKIECVFLCMRFDRNIGRILDKITGILFLNVSDGFVRSFLVKVDCAVCLIHMFKGTHINRLHIVYLYLRIL